MRRRRRSTAAKSKSRFSRSRASEISAFYAYIDAQFDDFETGAGDFTDHKMAQVPEDQYSAWVRYTLPLAASVGEVRLQANYAYQTQVFFSDTAQGPAKARRTARARKAMGS